MVISSASGVEKGEVESLSKTHSQENQKVECITLENYFILTKIDEKANWLREKGKDVCENILEKAVLDIHELKGQPLNIKGKYPISWGELKDIIKEFKYEKYLGVNIEDGIINSLKLEDKYGVAKYSFSPVLIRSLGKKYAKDDSTLFLFSLAQISEESNGLQPAVVIQVNGTPFYYDYSNEPPVGPNNNKPL